MSTEHEPLLAWLDKELRKAEHALVCRQQAKEVWSGGDEQQWRTISKSTGTRYMNKQERAEIAKREERIAVRADESVKMIKALIELVKIQKP